MDNEYKISLIPTSYEITGVDVAMHVLAQTTRFVFRKEMTAEQAAKLAIQIAKAFVDEINKGVDEVSGE